MQNWQPIAEYGDDGAGGDEDGGHGADDSGLTSVRPTSASAARRSRAAGRRGRDSCCGAIAIARALNVEVARVLYVGDTATDMKTGRSAGMFTVGVTWGFRQRDELVANGAQRIIDAPAQLLELI